MDGDPSLRNKCPVCTKPSDLGCGSCKKVNYCSRDHQKSHWKTHKSECFPAILATDAVVGRHLVATRDIGQGEIIFREKPLISGPLAKEDALSVCLSCFKRVTTDFRCSECKWPVCNSKCEKDPLHAQNECPIFKDRVPPVSGASESSFYEKIIILRGVLLKDRNPQIWEKILQLEDHKNLRKRDHNSRLMSHATIHFIRMACGLTEADNDTIEHILGSVVVNAFVSDDSVSAGDLYRNGSYLYFYASLPAHDCTPNSSWVIQANSEFIIRASIPIKAGESITQLYTQPTFGTIERRLHLRESKFFDCNCKRCRDPTELSTYFSAVKCPICTPPSPSPSPSGTDEGSNNNNSNSGYILLENPLEDSSSWRCNNSSKCGRVIPEDVVEELMYSISADLSGHQQTVDDPKNNCNYTKSIGILEKLLKAHQGKTVHHNHFAMHSIENDLLQRMSFVLSSSNFQNQLSENEKVEMAERMINLAEKCLKIADIIWPGYNRHRGRLLYFLQQALIVPVKRTVNQKRTKKLNDDKILELKTKFLYILEIRQLVNKILAIEPEGREENFIANLMTEDTVEMQNLKKFFKIS